jgi:predicted membrane protein
MAGEFDGAASRPARSWARAFELAAVGAISLALTLDPYILGGVSSSRVHAGLPVLMLGVSSAFADGLGFSASSRLMRTLFHPALAWALIGVGMSLMLLG